MIACPSCGHTDVTFGWDGVVSVNVVDGVVQSIEVGGVFGVQPDRFMCGGCGTSAEITTTSVSSSGATVREALPDLLRRAQDVALATPHQSDDGWTVYGQAGGSEVIKKSA